MGKNSPKNPDNQEHNQPIRVLVRGIAGLLGIRLARNIANYHHDIQVVAGVVRNDRTVEDLLTRIKGGRDILSETKLYMDEKHTVIKEMNEKQSLIHFEPADQMPGLKSICDVVVDTTKNRSGNSQTDGFGKRYQEFCGKGGKVILQSGEYPRGQLITPPLLAEKKDEECNMYRQGDCILSGTIPIIAAIQQFIKRFRIAITMQLDEPLHDYTTEQNIQSMYVAEHQREIVEKELETLFPGKFPEVESVIQIPAHDYYTGTLTIEVEQDITHEQIQSALSNAPRIYMTPKHIKSTGNLDKLIREDISQEGKNVSSIGVYGSSLSTYEKDNRRMVRLIYTIYSRLAAVLPNVDAIRIVARNTEPLTAMRITDQNMNLINSELYE